MLLSEFKNFSQLIMKAMIFAAGLGTRLKDETLHKPKALVEVGKKTLLQHAVEKLKSEGVTEIIVNVHHFSGQIIEFLGRKEFGVSIKISDETDKLLNTGGGLKKAASLLKNDEPVLIYNVDILSDLNLRELMQIHNRSGALATVVVRKRETERYFLFNRKKRLIGWVNKKTGEKKIAAHGEIKDAIEMAFSGIHIVSPEIFHLMPPEDCFSIIDLYIQLAENYLITGYFDDSEWWVDVGKPEDLAAARQFFESQAKKSF